jgi:hypothetical protein
MRRHRKSRRPPAPSHRRVINPIRGRNSVNSPSGFLYLSYEMRRPFISHSYGIVGTSCLRIREQQPASARRHNRHMHHDHHAADMPGSIETADAGTLNGSGRARQPKLRQPADRPAGQRDHVVSTARSRHHQRGDSGIFHWPQQRRLLARPRRQGQARRNIPVRKLGIVVCKTEFPALGMRDNISIREVRTRSGKPGQSADRSSRTTGPPRDARPAANGCRRRQAGGND